MNKLLYSGKWFLPNNMDNRLHGKLYQNSENRFVLELVGVFNDPNKRLLNIEEFEIILGESLCLTDKFRLGIMLIPRRL